MNYRNSHLGKIMSGCGRRWVALGVWQAKAITSGCWIKRWASSWGWKSRTKENICWK